MNRVLESISYGEFLQDVGDTKQGKIGLCLYRFLSDIGKTHISPGNPDHSDSADYMFVLADNNANCPRFVSYKVENDNVKVDVRVYEGRSHTSTFNVSISQFGVLADDWAVGCSDAYLMMTKCEPLIKMCDLFSHAPFSAQSTVLSLYTRVKRTTAHDTQLEEFFTNHGYEMHSSFEGMTQGYVFTKDDVSHELFSRRQSSVWEYEVKKNGEVLLSTKLDRPFTAVNVVSDAFDYVEHVLSQRVTNNLSR